MKSTLKRWSLAIAVFLAALLMALGGMTLIRAHADEAEPAGVMTHEGDFYTLTYDENAPSVGLLIDANVLDYSTSTDFRELGSTLKTVVTDLFVKGIMRSSIPASKGRERLAAPALDLPDIGHLTKEDIDKYIADHLSDPAEVEKYLDGGYDIVIQYAAEMYESAGMGDYNDFLQEVQERLDEVVETVYPDRSKEEKDDLKGKLNGYTQELVQEVKENGGAPSYGIGDVIQHLTRVTVDGIVVLENSNDDIKILTGGVKTLLSRLPRPADIVNASAEELEHLLGYEISVETDLGNFKFDATFGLTGDASELKTMLRFADRYIDVTRTDGVPTAVVRVPEAAAKYLLRFMDTAQITPATKDILLSFLGTKTVGEYTFEEAKSVFDELLAFAADEANDHYLVELFKGDEAILKVARKIIGKLHSDKDFYEKCMRKAEILFGQIPARIADKCALDFYEGEGQFSASGEVGIKAVIDKAFSVLDSLNIDVASYVDIVEEYLDTDRTVALRVDVHIEGLYKITYLGEEGADAKEMLLPVGASIAQFGGETEEGAYWVDAEDTEDVPAVLETMPGHDVTVKLFRESEEKIIDLAGATWVGNPVSVEYDGQDHQNAVTLKGISAEIARQIKYVWTKGGEPVNEVKEVGSYSVTVAPVDEECTIENDPGAYTFKITAKQEAIDLTGYKWKNNSPVVYDGEDHIGEVSLLDLPDDIAERIEYVWTKDDVVVTEAIHAGVYSVSVKAKDGSAVLQPVAAEFEITPIVIDVNDFINHWVTDDTNALTDPTFDGKEHRVSLTDLPEYLTVTYTGDKATTEGTHETVAAFAIAEGEDENDYVFKDDVNTLTLTWHIKSAGGDVDVDTLLYHAGLDLYVFDQYGEFIGDSVSHTDVPASEFKQYEKLLNAILKDKQGTLGAAYDIQVLDADGNELHTPGKLLVRIRIPEGLKGDEFVIVHYPADGGAELVSATTYRSEEGFEYLQFDATQFSVYGIAALGAIPAASMWWMWLLIAIIIALLIVTIVLLAILLKKKTAQETAAEEEAQEIAQEAEEEAPAEEETEEPVEEPAEEVPEEEPVEEPAEEVPEEEPVEEPAEEVPEEEPVEEPAEGVPAEEPVEEPAEEVPAEEPADKPEIPAIIAVESKEENMKAQNTELATAQDGVMYDRSFTARIAQADETVRKYYHEIKAELVSYKGVKSRISWTADSFNKGRNKCAKMQIKGKTLVLYLALDPEEVASKYHTQSVSGVAKYAAVPTKLRIRNPRSLKYAKELIAQLMEKTGIAKAAHAPAAVEIPVQTTEELLAAGLVKSKKGIRPSFWGKVGE